MEQISNPAGLRVLDSLIQLITNKTEVKKILEEIESARQAANERIKIVGTIKQIEARDVESRAMLAEAESTLQSAKSEADKILGKAGTKAAAEKAKQKKAREILQAQEDRDAQLDARERSVTAREQELQAQMDQAAVQHQEAVAMREQADVKMAEAESKLKAFQEVVARMQ